MLILVHNSVGLAVDGDAIEKLRDSSIRVAIDICKGLLVVDDDRLAGRREVENAGRKDVRRKCHELNASSKDLAIRGNGSANEQVFQRNVDAIAYKDNKVSAILQSKGFGATAKPVQSLFEILLE